MSRFHQSLDANCQDYPAAARWTGDAGEPGRVLCQELSPGPLSLHEDRASGPPGLQPVPREARLCPHPAARGGDACSLPHGCPDGSPGREHVSGDKSTFCAKASVTLHSATKEENKR